MIGSCIGLLFVLTVALRWGARPVPAKVDSSSPIVIVPSQTSVVSAPTRLATEATGNTETTADAARMRPYRLVVGKALGLDQSAVFRDVAVVESRQRVVCGEVAKSATAEYQRFVYVGSAQIAALNDGSADFRTMQAGACGKTVP